MEFATPTQWNIIIAVCAVYSTMMILDKVTYMIRSAPKQAHYSIVAHWVGYVSHVILAYHLVSS